MKEQLTRYEAPGYLVVKAYIQMCGEQDMEFTEKDIASIMDQKELSGHYRNLLNTAVNEKILGSEYNRDSDTMQYWVIGDTEFPLPANYILPQAEVQPTVYKVQIKKKKIPTSYL